MGKTLIFNVSDPTLELFRPVPGTANGAVVNVAPGGGFVAIGYEQGGTAIARRLAEHGITAVVLKYRTIRSLGRSSRHSAGTTSDAWFTQFLRWMIARGLLHSINQRLQGGLCRSNRNDH